MLDQCVVPVDGDDLLEVDADVEQRVVPCAFGHALGAQRLQARRAILDRMVRLFRTLRKLQVGALDPLLVQLVELFQGRSRAIVFDGVARGHVATEVRQVQEVARVATVNQDFRLFGEYLTTCLTQQGSTGFEKPLHLASGNRFFGK